MTLKFCKKIINIKTLTILKRLLNPTKIKSGIKILTTCLSCLKSRFKKPLSI